MSTGDASPEDARGAERNGGAAHALTTEVVGILDTIDAPIIVVDRDFTVVRFNRAARDALGLVSTDIGRRAGSIAVLADANDLEKLCARALADEAPIRRDVQS